MVALTTVITVCALSQVVDLVGIGDKENVSVLNTESILSKVACAIIMILAELMIQILA